LDKKEVGKERRRIRRNKKNKRRRRIATGFL
jgi:hypothetical protein